MKQDLVIGIDCSTTAAKAVVWTLRGKAMAEGRANYALANPHPGWGEQNPNDWWKATVKAIKDACKNVDAKRIAALCITHQRETFACLDAAGEPVRPAILWLDTRAKEEVAEFGNDSVHQLTGKPPNTATSWYKILWLKKHEPQTLKNTRWVVDVQAYLVQRLTGQWHTSYGSIDPMGLLNLKTFQLDDDLLKQTGLEAGHIPDIQEPGAKLGALRADVAKSLGLMSGLPIIAGTGDGQSAGLGANVTSAGSAYLNLGTGIVSGTFSNDYVCSRAFRTMTGAMPGTYTPETFIGGGTFNVSWFIDRFSEAADKPGGGFGRVRAMERAATQVPAGSEGLLHLPYLSGALAPYWDADARGVYFGLQPKHSKAHLYRALIEGLCMEQRLATTKSQDALGIKIQHVRIMGGGARSAFWAQILADVMQRNIEVSREAETTCLGAGMMAAAGVGLHRDMATAALEMSGAAKTYQPQAAASQTYDRFYDIYCNLYPQLKRSFVQMQSALRQTDT